MKVALIIDRFDAARGGGEGYAVSLARGLSLRGHEVHVFSHYCSERPPGIDHHRLPLVLYPRWLKVLSLAWEGSKVLRSGLFDVVQGFGGVPQVHVHRPGGGSELAWLEQDARSRGRPRPVEALARATSLKLAANLLVERAVYNKKDGVLVIANSQKVRSDILSHYRFIDPGRIRVVYNGVDLERFHPRNREIFRKKIRRELFIEEETVVLLFLAHNFRLKGLHCLMEALRRTRQQRQDWVLLVGGRGRRAPYERLATKLGINDRTLFLGHVERPEALLAACDLLVHPTFYDPFSNVCLEAMASGVPVVTTRQNGAAELVEDEVSGYVVPTPEDSERLAMAISSLMDPVAREAMGRCARHVAEGLAWDRHISSVEDIYREVVNAR